MQPLWKLSYKKTDGQGLVKVIPVTDSSVLFNRCWHQQNSFSAVTLPCLATSNCNSLVWIHKKSNVPVLKERTSSEVWINLWKAERQITSSLMAATGLLHCRHSMLWFVLEKVIVLIILTMLVPDLLGCVCQAITVVVKDWPGCHRNRRRKVCPFMYHC